MPTTTPKLALPIPSPSDPPDAPGQIYALGLKLDDLVDVNEPAGLVNLSTGVTFDSSSGLNKVTIIGDLRIVHVSLFRSAGDAVVNYGFAQMAAGHRPVGNVMAACIVYDGGQQITGTAVLGSNGGIGVVDATRDTGADGVFSGMRATFIYPIT
jgi:hypothetical protein